MQIKRKYNVKMKKGTCQKYTFVAGSKENDSFEYFTLITPQQDACQISIVFRKLWLHCK